MQSKTKKILGAGAATVAVLAMGVGGASAAGLIGHSQIKDGAVHSDTIKDGTIKSKDLKPNVVAKLNATSSGLTGAYYATAAYNAGDTNQGAIATVACSAETDVAISGGVQMIGVGGKNSAVGSSFPGRMDWSTNTPKADRLDGWIVQFDATVAPEKVTLWALCVPGAEVPVVQTYSQN